MRWCACGVGGGRSGVGVVDLRLVCCENLASLQGTTQSPRLYRAGCAYKRRECDFGAASRRRR